MSEVLDITPLRVQGRPRKRLAASLVRSLCPADLALLETVKGSKPKPLQALRDSPHRLARCLASGMSHAQAAMQSGYSQSRVAILVADPSFKDLIEVYRRANAEAYTEYTDVAIGNLLRGERLVEDTLEAVGEREVPLELGELRPVLDIISDRADRLGYPKTAVGVNLSASFGDRLSAARRRASLEAPGPKDESSNP